MLQPHYLDIAVITHIYEAKVQIQYMDCDVTHFCSIAFVDIF